MEEALRVKEAKQADEVVAVSIGPKQVRNALPSSAQMIDAKDNRAHQALMLCAAASNGFQLRTFFCATAQLPMWCCLAPPAFLPTRALGLPAPPCLQAADTLRTALAMGADRAVHVQTGEGEAPEPLAVAKLLAAVSWCCCFVLSIVLCGYCAAAGGR